MPSIVAVEELSKSKIPSLLVTLLYMWKYRCLLYSDVELTDYHNYTQLTAELDRLVREHPDLAKVYSLGQTVEGRELAVIQISRGVNQVQFANNCMSVCHVCHAKSMPYTSKILQFQADRHVLVLVFACTLFHCLKAKANNERKLKATENNFTSNAGVVL